MKYKIILIYIFFYFVLINLNSNNFQIANHVFNKNKSDKNNYIIEDINYKVLISTNGIFKVFKLKKQTGEIIFNLEGYNYINNIYYIINKNNLLLFFTTTNGDASISFLTKINLDNPKIEWNFRIPCHIRVPFIVEDDYLYFISSVGTGKLNIISGNRIWNIGNENYINDKNDIFYWGNFDHIYDMKLEDNKLLYYIQKDVLNKKLELFFILNKKNGVIIN